MNSVIETIKNRRSIRKYMPDQLKEDEINAIIEAGLYAPSAHNDQPWHFTVIQDKELMRQISIDSKEAVKKVSKNATLQKMASNEELDIFYGAPTIIVVSGEEKAMMPTIDCAAATQNMLLAAESLGIGSCWNGLAAFLFQGEGGDEYAKKLGLSQGYQPYYAVALGYKVSDVRRALPRREGTVSYIR
ncbi:Nitroreductase [Peptoclostridium litorale DSM 5388]|uniref:Nitroreductase domain-containing protein n=1 Tax=Peptoclostridium litorale DSM 5388 TaxID=1121324 RepID=A0A069RHX1_PEPLI|nr:nitroreductase family protein [Peptoclostridium litorale]KDR95755.1 hypothetical protein CLIT_10c04820 [Peptoclostridium litorale DSM 5388]SIO21968.1 Nitroreductase [Peptoclostridium litorale DSM 5388]